MKKYLSLFVILFCLPFILWAVCGIMPTFDDYTSLQSTWWACVVMAVLSKENGLAWAVVPPIIGYAFGKVNSRQALRDIGIKMTIKPCYTLFTFLLTSPLWVAAQSPVSLCEICRRLYT